MGVIETTYGILQISAGGAALIGECLSGGGVVLVPKALAVTVEGVAIAIDGSATISQGLSMIQGDLGKYQEGKKRKKKVKRIKSLKRKVILIKHQREGRCYR